MLNIDLIHLVTAIGYFGILLVVFVETGIFVCFFLPGDSLLFSAGLLASQGVFKIWILVPTTIAVAILGYFLAYWLGEKLGGWLLRRPDSIWFKKSYLIQAKKFYDKHGGKSLILGRLIPVVRTFVPIVAGMTRMEYYRYIIFNVVGAFVWGGGVTLVGYYFGYLIPDVGEYILLIVLFIILLSLLPGIWHAVKSRFFNPPSP
ncbi:DedA family protein [Coxiella burnetii]|uniref:DedA family protein n=1 Tax=Coxiella burnetii TaxID=777 RepID=UPI0022314CCE|nr:VTT domain-containing protein [Coxiella burnetii]